MAIMETRSSLSWLTIGSALIFFIGGGVIGAWLTQPREPWIEIDPLQVTHRPVAGHIVVTGHYTINRRCGDLAIWRIELIDRENRITQHEPSQPRSLQRGGHFFYDIITIPRDEDPENWTVRQIISCLGEFPEIVASPAALVRTIHSPTTVYPS